MKVYAVVDNKTYIQGKIINNDNRFKLVIRSKDIPKNSGEIYVSCDFFKSNVGDNGYFVCGYDFGEYSAFLTYFTEREDYTFKEKRMLLNCFGIKNNFGTYMGTFSGMEYDYNLKIEKKGNTYSMGFYYSTNEIDLYKEYCHRVIQVI